MENYINIDKNMIVQSTIGDARVETPYSDVVYFRYSVVMVERRQ